MTEDEEEKFYRDKVNGLKIMLKFRRKMVEDEMKNLTQMEDLIFLAEGELDRGFLELETIINLCDIKFRDE